MRGALHTGLKYLCWQMLPENTNTPLQQIKGMRSTTTGIKTSQKNKASA